MKTFLTNGVTALTNGHYVVRSTVWNIPAGAARAFSGDPSRSRCSSVQRVAGNKGLGFGAGTTRGFTSKIPAVFIYLSRSVTALAKRERERGDALSHMSSLPLQHGKQPATRSGHCEDLDRASRESLSAASPHSHAKTLEASVALLMRHLELTHRQAEVLHWVADGKTNDEISVILGCSFFTVKNHLRKIFQHLNVHSRTAAASPTASS